MLRIPSVQDIKALAASFASVSFINVYGQCNLAAHSLARSAELFISVTFRNSIPDCIRQTICNGLSCLIKSRILSKKKQQFIPIWQGAL
jgi:hypothetical protein